MLQENMQTVRDHVITPKEIMNFLKRNRRTILIWGMLGLVASTVYATLTPKVFEVRWQMSMARMILGNSYGNSEEPAALIQRLRSSLAYPASVRESCGKSGDEEVGEYLDRTLQVQSVKYVPNAVEFKLRAPSVEQATLCAKAIVAMVVEQQRDIIVERQSGKQEQLEKYQKSLKEEFQQLEMLKKTELGNFGYLAKLDNLTWLRTRIDALQEELFFSQKFPAKLNAPIEVSNKPVSPKLQMVFSLGLLFGLMMGMVFAIAREGWSKAMTVA